ncbi:FAD-binding protein [Paraeggerthella hongkongensis]|uniref:FAD-binding protein n=1 Tax=Paraeggerthella hominis TaxID=2897351 RepID=UPI001C102695|nr:MULTISPECIES: FAD-binding protein [Paraeggerthella]MBU5404873.1 FAD-binding protein [Paraeggerthella hongkongensis]MCD2433139.1 FAD-binding protein [Paraeggerthella hominis]
MELSRRNFLAGAASAGVLGVMGLAGCAPQPAKEPDGGSAATGEAASARPAYYMCDENWLGSAPEIADGDIAETKSFDVVVVGGGHAGTQAALAAAQEGASVAVIEKHNDGEIVYRGDDICSYNSKLLESWGFGPYDLNEIVNEYVRRANGRCSTDVIRSFVYNSGEMMDNLASLVPDTSNVFDFEGGECIVQIAYDKPNGADYPVEVSGYKMWASTVQTVGTKNADPVGKSGLTDVSRLAELETYCRDAAEDLGAKWFCGHAAVRCVQSDEGAVLGVIAQDADGSYVRFDASKGVILATGDFGANADMVWELCSECAENAERHGVDRETLTGMTDCDGSGHKMGCWAGGAIESHPRPVAGDAPSISFGPWGSAPSLWMNCKGERFMNESYAGLVLAQSCRQPIDLEAAMVGNFAIMDKKHMQYIQAGGLDHGAPNWGFPEGIEEYRAQMDGADPSAGTIEVRGLEIANRTRPFVNEVFVGATVEEALKNAGLSGEALETAKATVERYNELCAAGVDADYGKPENLLIPIDEAPFYIAKQGTERLYGPGLNTLAGLCVNGSYQVLTASKNDVVKGLYAVGNTMGERYGNAYNCPSAGNNMGNAMTSGRVAGKHAARS